MLRSASLATKPPAYLFRYPSMSKSTETKSTSCAPSRCAASQPIPKFSFAFQCLAAPSGDRRGVFRFGEALFTDHLTTPQETFSLFSTFFRQTAGNPCFHWHRAQGSTGRKIREYTRWKDYCANRSINERNPGRSAAHPRLARRNHGNRNARSTPAAAAQLQPSTEITFICHR